MCLSYMATREEEHSTRGRANAVVKAPWDPAGAAALGDKRLCEVMDLCLECKARVAECPLSVDMATMKLEFLHAYQSQHGVSFRSRLFGRIRALNRVGSFTEPVSNWPLHSLLFRRLVEQVAGIDRRRPLPRFEREALPRWFAHRPEPTGPAPRGEVLVLADSFTSYTELEIGRAGIELLELAGWRVRLEVEGCCRRGAISKGLFDDARAGALDLHERLTPAAAQGIPIVGFEPSCLLALRDEHPSMLRTDAAETVAGQVRLVEELLLKALDDGGLTLAPPEGDGLRALFNGHCHQKASVGMADTVALLERLPGAQVTEVDAGCRGMAGSFELETEHYEMSLRIGGRRLFPSTSACDPDTVNAATGVSCRQQIAHGTDRVCQHPLVLFRAAVVS